MTLTRWPYSGLECAFIPGQSGPGLRLSRHQRWIMVRLSAAFLLTLPVAAAFTAAPALGQQQRLPPPAIYEERLPPVMGSYDDEDVLPPPGRAARPRPSSALELRAAFFPIRMRTRRCRPRPVYSARARQRPVGYGHQLDPQQPPAMDAWRGSPDEATIRTRCARRLV